MPPIIATIILTSLTLQACTPSPNRGWLKNAWYYDDNRGTDAKTDKPRIDGKNNER